VVDYPLTVSFRFGPLLAQTAYNVIARNQVRYPKALVAANWLHETGVDVVEDRSTTAGVLETPLLTQVQRWIAAHGCGSVVILGRTLGQLQAFEMSCLAEGVPYRVLGRGPVYQRREHQIGADYLRIGLAYDVPLDAGLVATVLRIINTPMRGLARDRMQQWLQRAHAGGQSLRDALAALHGDEATPRHTRERLDDLMALCEQLQRRCGDETLAHEVLQWLATTLRLDEHFVRSYGRGEAAAERAAATRHMVAVLALWGWSVPQYLDWLATADHTGGVPETEQLLLTTVYRAKGLEYDYVVVPAAVEGYMPAHGSSPEVYDRSDPEAVPVASDAIEEERRLFYVAVTRARALLSLGVPLPPAGYGRDALPSATPSRFVYEMKVGATEQIFASADIDSAALAETLAEHGASTGLLAHVARYFTHDSQIVQLCRSYSGTIWPMKPLKPKKK
jgi:DNA helicase-2/ATP-dependent DNA helicase PcrA